MRTTSLILLASIALPLTVAAQVVTNLPATEIENFELSTDAVIVKGYGEVGTVNTSAGVVSVRCKESDNATTGRKEYGISIVLESSPGGFLVVDYDELDPMLRGLDFLGKISYDVTPMPAFNAGFTTRSGFCVGAHSERRQSVIESFLQFGDSPRITLTPSQFTQFQNLISQAKTSLDVTRGKASSP